MLEAETHLAMNPNNSNIVVVVFQQSHSFRTFGVSGAHDTSGFRPDVVSGAESDSRGFHLGPEVLEEPECPVPA